MQDPLIGEVLSGTYRIVRLLGKGSMGTVYEAAHLRLPRRFAVKILSTSVNPEKNSVARFQQEAQVTSQLGHPHIVEVVDFNYTVDGLPFIVMELLDGEDLATRLERLGRLELPEVERLLEQTASALTAAHGKGVVHRDLKPQNIFISKAVEGGEVVKVVDFGISKVLGQQGNLTTADVVIGTPYFMSPEQALGKRELIDGRTDVFALGVILYAMLTGELPFEGEAIPNILYNIVHGERPSLAARCPELPPAVETELHRALSRDPKDRHPTAEALKEAFSRALHDGVAGASVTGSASKGEASVNTAETARAGDMDDAATTRVMASPPDQPPTGARRLALMLAAFLVLALGAGTVAYILASRPPADRGAVATPDAAPALAPAPDSAPDSAPAPAPDSAPAPAPASAPAPAPDSAPAADRSSASALVVNGKKKPRRRVRMARLTVHTRYEGKAYWAHVFLDGKKLGDSPIHRWKVRPGAHKVTVQRPGFKKQQMKVSLKGGESRTVTLSLERQ